MTPIWVLTSEATSLELRQKKQEKEKAPSQKGTEPLAKGQPLAAKVDLAHLRVQLSGTSSQSLLSLFAFYQKRGIPRVERRSSCSWNQTEW
jgi:hypothetical protein